MAALLIGAVTVWSYWPGLDGGFYFDDLTNIIEVPALHWQGPTWQEARDGLSGARLPRRWLANLTLGLNHAWGGLDPQGYHRLNLTIHLLVGAVLAWVAVLYARGCGGRAAGGIPALTAAVIAVGLFLVHPLNVQSVTYVVQRMTSLAALFSLLAFGSYMKARNSRGRGVWGWLCLAAAAWLLAVGSKETALALPAVLVAYELGFHGRAWRRRLAGWWRPGGGRWILIAAGVALAGALLLLIGLYLQAGGVSWEEKLPARDYSGRERVLTQARVHLFYLSLLLWPAPSRLNLDHPFAVSRSLLEPATLGSCLFWLVVVAAVVWLTRRRPDLGFPLAAYLLFHAVESGPVNLELVFEHRMYLPMTYLTLLLAVALARTPHRWSGQVIALALVVALPLAVATRSRNVTWSDPVALHYDCARKSPEKYRAQYNLATYLGGAGRYAEAIPVLQKALSLRPGSSEAHNQLGSVYLSLGMAGAALREYRTAVELAPDNAEAVFNLALALERNGHYAESAAAYRQFLEIAPERLRHARPRAEERLRWLSALPGRQRPAD